MMLFRLIAILQKIISTLKTHSSLLTWFYPLIIDYNEIQLIFILTVKSRIGGLDSKPINFMSILQFFNYYPILKELLLNLKDETNVFSSHNSKLYHWFAWYLVDGKYCFRNQYFSRLLLIQDKIHQKLTFF